MRIAQIRELDITNGEGTGVSLFTQGCPFHCKNCFNPETWDFKGGYSYTQEIKKQLLELISRPYIKRFTILGGEPFLLKNKIELQDLVREIKIKNPNIKIWAYSGNTFEKLLPEFFDLLQNIDILVDGRFIDELKDFNLKFRGSANQRMIDVQKSLKEGKVVLYNL